ncbi:hypothetical protein, partial [Dokdonella sp.]|uniref:hypothetical protein n=1 Tax=Dokdonella sp. TaxID=2291710 RepID=UPI002F428CA1
MKRRFLASLALACATPVVAQDLLQGTLELRWGDPDPGAASASRFEADLVGSDGTRHALDTASALRAAGNLYALAGREIALSTQPGPWPGGRVRAEAIVAADASIDAATVPRVSGSQPWVTLACKFSDVAAQPHDVPYFSTMLSNQTGRLDHYWREVSYDKADVAGSVAYGW